MGLEKLSGVIGINQCNLKGPLTKGRRGIPIRKGELAVAEEGQTPEEATLFSRKKADSGSYNMGTDSPRGSQGSITLFIS